MLNAVQKANQRLKEKPPDPKDIQIFSMDAAALYPSLNLEDIKDAVWDLVTTSNFDFKHIDSKQLCKFVAVNYLRETLVKVKVISTIPKRQVEIDGTERGRPSMAYLDSDHYSRTVNGQTEKNVEKWVWNGVKEPSLIQRKKLVALMLTKTLELTLTNHLYQFDGDLYRQLVGGPIGENLTQVCAKIVMKKFTKIYKNKLNKLGLLDHTILLKVYVDDLNQAGYCLPTGTTYTNGALYLPGQGWRGKAPPGKALGHDQRQAIAMEAERLSTRETTQEDRERASAAIYRQVANEVLPRSVTMKEDTPGNHPNKMIPILDTQMAMVDGQIVHHHYSKPMASLEVTLKRSVMSIFTK